MTLVLYLIVFFLAGLGSSFALYGPGAIELPLRIALVFCCGYLLPGIVSFGLTAAGILHPGSMAIGLALVIAAVWWLALRRGPVKDHLAACSSELRAARWPLIIGLLALTAFAVHRATFPPELNFTQSTAFRYWADGAEIADAGAVPSQVLHWGSAYVPTVSKVFLNSFTASTIFLLGRDPLPALTMLSWTASVGLAFGLWAFGRELGLGSISSLLAILLLADPGLFNTEITVDLSTYKTEVMGRMVAVCAVVVGIRAVRGRTGWREPLIAGVLFALAAATHSTPFVVACVIFLWWAVAEAVAERRFLAVAKRVFASLAMVLPLVALIPLAAGGDFGWEGIRTSARYVAVDGDLDPTAIFASPRPYLQDGRLGGRTEIPSVGQMAADYAAKASGIPASTALTYGLPAILILAAIGMFLLFPRRLKHVGIVALGVSVSLFVLALLFTLRYETYIPATTGIRRLFDYSSIPLVLVALGLLEAVLLGLRRLSRPASTVVSGALVIAITCVGLVMTRPSGERLPLAQRAPQVFSWIRANTPCDARILATHRTEGVFQAMSGRVGILEGMSPYLRPRMLNDVIQLLQRARTFFTHPSASKRFLTHEGVDYVFVKGDVEIGGARIAPPNAPKLRNRRFLRLVASTEAAQIYEVMGQSKGPTKTTIDPPGYFCKEEMLIGREP